MSKNKSLTPIKYVYKEWLEVLIRSCLIASHDKKNITCVIEVDDTLDTLIDKPFILDIPIQKEIVDILLNSTHCDPHTFITVTKNGMMVSINTKWSDLIINELIFMPVDEEQLLKEYARIITSKTDSIVIHINSNHELHFIAHQASIIENITIEQSLKLIKNLLYKKNNKNNQTKEIHHDSKKSTIFSNFYKN